MSLHWVSKLRRVISRKNSNPNSGTSTASKHLSSARHRFQRRWWYNKNTWRSLQKNWRLNKTKSFWWVNSQVKPSQSRWTKSRPNITHIVLNPSLFEYSHWQHNRRASIQCQEVSHDLQKKLLTEQKLSYAQTKQRSPSMDHPPGKA